MESSIPSLFLGTYQNSSNLSKVIETAFEEGVYGFDTAPSYGTEGIWADVSGIIYPNIR